MAMPTPYKNFLNGNLLPSSSMIVQDLGLQSNSCRPQSPVNEGIIMSTGAIQTMAIANLDLFLENNFSLLYGMKIMHHLKSKSCDVIWKEKV